jgi:hypothetical protein
VKKFQPILVIIIFVMIFLGNSHVARADYTGKDNPLFISMGYNHALSLSLRIPESRFFGIELGALFNGRSTNYINEPCPSSYTIVEERNIEANEGFDELVYLPLTDQFSLFGGYGLYFQKYAEVSRSEDGTRYCQGTDHRIEGSHCEGIQIKFGNGMIGLEHHSIRGYSLQFSFAQ